jgi:DNA polymerase-3 subunit gamma/tau
VLGVADAEQLFAAVDAVIAGDPAAALHAAADLAAAGRDPGQLLRDLESHARELLTVQILGEVPPELRVTPDRDERLLAQAGRLAETDAVRLLELVCAALEACSGGAQPRIQLELALIKAAAPELDPSMSALLARMQRLERGAAPGRPVAATPPREEQEQGPAAVAGDQGPAAVAGDQEPAAVRGAGEERDGAPPDAMALPDQSRAEPEPASTPGVPAPAGEGEIQEATLSELVNAWPAVVELVRGANAMLAVLLDGASPVELEDGVLTLAWPPASDFYRRKAEQDEHRRATAEALRNVTGLTFNLRYTLAPTEADEHGPEAESEPVLSEAELVRTLVEEFDAQEIPEADDEEA